MTFAGTMEAPRPAKKGQRWRDTEFAEMKARYAAGETAQQVAEAIGRPAGSVRVYLSRNDWNLASLRPGHAPLARDGHKGGRVAAHVRDSAMAFIAAGGSYYRAQQRFGVSSTTVRRWAVASGVLTKNKPRRKK